jgi:hypothetical protein
MLRCLCTSIVFVLLALPDAKAAEKDYLQRGEEKLTADYQIKYDRAIRHVLSRGWRRDVILRMVDLPPFQPEWVVGIAHTADGYHAFEAEASQQIWNVMGLGADHPKKHTGDFYSVRPILHKRAIARALGSAHCGAMASSTCRFAKLRTRHDHPFGYRSVHLPSQLFAD